MGAYSYDFESSFNSAFEFLLESARRNGACDLYLRVDNYPMIKKNGKVVVLTEQFGKVQNSQMAIFIDQILSSDQVETLVKEKSIDVGLDWKKQGRFRLNISKNSGTLDIAIRLISQKPWTFEQCQLPQSVSEIAKLQRGLVLVTGKAGSGKSTTLAAILQEISKTQSRHIVTIEDPIEYKFTGGVGFVAQKEVGSDTPSFATGLRTALRQNPDVILIGEMRDKETIEAALMAAETGHLVLSTLHSSDTASTMNRILSVFPADQHGQIRELLASSLKAVVSQRLLPQKDNHYLVPAVEVLFNNEHIQHLLRDGHPAVEILDAIEDGHATYGMQSFDQSLMDLYTKQLISYQTALESSSRPTDFELRCSGVKSSDGEKWVNFDFDPRSSASSFEVSGEIKGPESWMRSKPKRASRRRKRRRKADRGLLGTLKKIFD